MIFNIYIENERLDVYPDENIKVTQVVQDIGDISKVFGDFTQTFSVPASDRNNRIFKHFYNFNINDGFDARIKHDAFILLDGFNFKIGKITLQDVTIKDGAAANYRIQFFSNITQIKDKFGEDKLEDLPYLSNYNHVYSPIMVGEGAVNGLDLNGEEDAIIYPLLSYDKRWIYQTATYINTDKITNIAYNYASEGIFFSELKPAIKVKLIMDAISDKYDLTFSDDFFASDIWQNLYMNLSRSDSSIFSNTEKLAYENDYFIEDEYNNEYKPPLYREFLARAEVKPKAGYEDVEYKVKIVVNDEEVYLSDVRKGDQTGNDAPRFFESNYQNKGDINVKIFLIAVSEQFEAEVKPLVTLTITEEYAGYPFFAEFNVISDVQPYSDVNINVTTLDVLTQVPDLSVIDFFQGILRAFNLVVIPNEDGTLYVNDLNNWYKDGRIINIDKYVDESTKTIQKGKLFSSVKLSYEKNDSFLAAQFEDVNNRQFGSVDEDLKVSGLPANGEKLEIELPFSNPVFERLTDLNTNSKSNIQYGYIVDDKQESFNSLPFLFYATNIDASIGYNLDASTYVELTKVFIPSHNIIYNASSSFAFQFAAEFSEWSGNPTTENLYSRFHQDYIIDAFSKKRRIVKFKGKLPTHLLTTIKNNDRLVYKGDRYLINKLDINITTSEVEFELLNDIFEGLKPVQGEFVPNNLLVSSDKQTNGTTYIKAGFAGETFAVSNIPSWINCSTTLTAGVPFGVIIQKNNTGEMRRAALIINDNGIKEFEIIQKK